jgi:hypothetical protein
MDFSYQHLANAYALFNNYTQQEYEQRRSIVDAIAGGVRTERLAPYLENGLLSVSLLHEKARFFLTDKKLLDFGKPAEVLAIGEDRVYTPIGYLSMENLSNQDLVAVAGWVQKIYVDIEIGEQVGQRTRPS